MQIKKTRLIYRRKKYFEIQNSGEKFSFKKHKTREYENYLSSIWLSASEKRCLEPRSVYIFLANITEVFRERNHERKKNSVVEEKKIKAYDRLRKLPFVSVTFHCLPSAFRLLPFSYLPRKKLNVLLWKTEFPRRRQK